MNRFECIGRLTKDVELTTTTSGVSVARTSIAVDRKYKDQEGNKQTDFFNIEAWRGLADNIAKYCKKGSKVFIAGELQNQSWDKEDGTKGYAIKIVVNECEFLDTKNNQENETNTNTNAELKPIDDDSLPF